MNMPTPLPPSIIERHTPLEFKSQQLTDLDEFQETGHSKKSDIWHCFHSFCFSTRADRTKYLAVYQLENFLYLLDINNVSRVYSYMYDVCIIFAHDII